MNSLFRTLVATAVIGFAGITQAATMTAPVSPTGNFTVTDTTGPQSPETFHFTVTPTTSPNPVIYFDTNPAGSQSPPSIASLIIASYGLSSTLTLKSSCDDTGGSCPGLTSASNSLFSLTNVPAFDYLAIHFGGGELFFHWTQPITTMTLAALDGFPGGLSNYRSYLSTPLPGALALFLGAIGFMGARRKLAQRSGTPAFAMA